MDADIIAVWTVIGGLFAYCAAQMIFDIRRKKYLMAWIGGFYAMTVGFLLLALSGLIQ